MNARILVASDGRHGAVGALRVAGQMEERGGVRVEVVGACEPTDYYRIPGVADDDVPFFPDRALQMMRRQVQRQIERVGAGERGWPVDVERGSFAPTVLRAAIRRRSTLVLIGLPPAPDAADLWVGRESVQKVVQLSHVPVLAVPASATALPSRALVALDFSRFSFQAVWEVAKLLGAGAQLHLVHVLSEPLEDAESWESRYEWADRYCSGVQRRLEGLAAAVQGVSRADIYVHRLSGEPTHTILRLADELDVDLLAMGSHGHGYLGRAAIGGTFSRVLRCAQSAMLIVPPTGIAAELVRDRAAAEQIAAEQELENSDRLAAARSYAQPADEITLRRRSQHEEDVHRSEPGPAGGADAVRIAARSKP